MKIILTQDKHPSIDLRSEPVKEFIEAKTRDQKAEILERFSEGKYGYQNIFFEWENNKDGPYVFSYSLSKDFSNPITFETKNSYFDFASCLVVGRTYYWRVTNKNNKVVVNSWFKTKEVPGAFVNVPEIRNVRDIGGWKTEDHKTVKYGKIYRGSRLNTPELQEKERLIYLIHNHLMWKSEIDLRHPEEDYQEKCFWKDDGVFFKRSLGCYVEIFPDIVWPGFRTHYTHLDTPPRLKEIFEFLANEDNYPVYIHCHAGADRTGTLVWLINALLGVSEEDLFTDYELTSFDWYNPRYRGEIKDGHFISEEMENSERMWVVMGAVPRIMMEKYGTGDNKLSSAVENYLMSYCHIEKETLDAIKSIMLKG